MAEPEEDENIIKRINSNDSSVIYKALKQIKMLYFNDSNKMLRFFKSAVIKKIISFIEHPHLSTLSLSIIADLCMKDNFIPEIIQNYGINVLLRNMDRTVNEDIRNRACRALGNIANSKIGLEAVYSVQPIPVILSFLSGTENVNCQQTAARTLRILAKDQKSRDFIIQENGIGLVCDLLHSKSKDVIKCSIRALAELTENCNIHSARQVKERHVLKILVELYSFSNKDIKEPILAILKNLSAIEEIRHDLLKIGALKIFAEACMGSVSSESSRLAVLALCCLLDRLHIWEGNGVTKKGGLKAVLEILRQSTFEDIHKQILIALYPHCYEPNIPDILFEQEIIEILLQVLKRFIACNKDGHSNPALEYFHLQVPSEVDGELSRNSLASYNSEEDLSLEEKSYENSNFSTFSDSISKFPFIQPFPNSIKSFPNYNSSSYLNLHSSGAESNCSPCSSRSNNPRSPSIYSDSEVSSPLIDPWSPQSIVNANECLSPVFSCSEDSCDDNNFKKVDEKYVQLSSLTRTEKTTTNDIYDSITVCSPKSCQSATVVISMQDNKPDTLFTPIHKDKDESDGLKEFHDEEPLSSILSCSEDTSDDDDWIIVDDYIYPNSTNVTLTHETSVCDSVVCSSSTSDPNLDSKYAKECDISSATRILVDDDILPISINVTPINAKSVCDLAVCVPSTTSQDTVIMDSKSAQKCNLSSTAILKDSNLSYSKKDSVKIEAMHSPKDLSPTVKRKADVDIIGIPIKKVKLSSAPNVSHKLEMFAEKCTLDHCVLLLLDQLSFHLEKKTNSQIASRSCFSVLMDYIVSINNPNPKAEKILLNLVKNRYCFEKLIMSGFVADMDKIMIVNHSLKNCIRCSSIHDTYTNLISALRTVAESTYGVGTLCHILSTKDETYQFYAVHAMSHLIHSTCSLFKLTFQCNGLSLLFSSLLNELKEVSPLAVISLCNIYQKLPKTTLITNLNKCCFSKSCCLNVLPNCMYLEDAITYDVTFLVDNHKVSASREKLSRNSEYFRALLDGHFSEKGKDIILMDLISVTSLTAIFHFLHGCLNNNTCRFLKDLNVEELLDLLSESEPFLLSDMKAFIIDSLCHSFTPKDIFKIYKVAKIFDCTVLCQKTLHFVLSTNISHTKFLVKFFEYITSFKEYNALSDIKILIQNIFAECRYYACKD